jgi:V8-like Glu-specific endopeptidase
MLAALAFSSPAYALEGEAWDGHFPFVVQIFSDYGDGIQWPCSSSVIDGGLVVTAAHCVMRPTIRTENGREIVAINLAQAVRVKYVDRHGVESATNAVRATWEPAMPRYLAVWLGMPRPQEDDPSDTQKAKTRALNGMFAQFAPMDVAYLVTERYIDLKVYAHSVLDLMGPITKSMSNKRDWALTSEAIEAAEKIFWKRFDRTLSENVVVGFGGHGCMTPGKLYTCTIDSTRRWSKLSIISGDYLNGTSVSTDGSSRSQASPPPYRVPWVWQAGPGSNGTNPTVGGDSGGPLLLMSNTKKKKWFHVGTTSGWTGYASTHASLLSAPYAWWQAVSSPQYQILKILQDEARRSATGKARMR